MMLRMEFFEEAVAGGSEAHPLGMAASEHRFVSRKGYAVPIGYLSGGHGIFLREIGLKRGIQDLGERRDNGAAPGRPRAPIPIRQTATVQHLIYFKGLRRRPTATLCRIVALGIRLNL